MTTTAVRKPATLGIDTARRAIPMGRNAAYEAARLGELIPGVPVLKVGQRLRVVTADLERVLGIDVADHIDLTEAD